MDSCAAALAYASAGIYVLPVKPRSKNPGSRVGDKWQMHSTRDTATIVACWAGSSDGIALHAGRSGLVIFDVDNPENMPEVLAQAIADTKPPFQQSRPDNPGRGHYMFACPPGRVLGNGVGKLGGDWGQIRGRNGVVIAAPSLHKDADDGAAYEWVTTGPVPVLPASVADLLPDATETVDAATDEDVKAFLEAHVEASRPELVSVWERLFLTDVEAGKSRHDSMVSKVAGAMSEARAGYISAQVAADALKAVFVAAVTDPSRSGTRTPAKASTEWAGLLSWAVAQANNAPLEEIHNRVASHAPVEAITVISPDGIDDDPAVTFAVAPDGHRTTDAGNAARFADLVGHQVRFVHSWGHWIVYRRGVWVRDPNGAMVQELAKAVARSLLRQAAKAKSADAMKRLATAGMAAESRNGIAAMISLARGIDDLIVDHEQLDADPELLNVENGTINLRTKVLQPHNPGDLCTIQAPVAYDPAAKGPTWEACLQRWQPDDEVRRYLQTEAGAATTGHPTETLTINLGSGGNGKSKYFGALQHVLGGYAVVPHKSVLVASKHDQHATVVASLFRARLAVAAETAAGDSLNDEMIKNLTGGDRLRARRMREDEWSFDPSHTMVLSSNHRPQVKGGDEGIWRRIRLVNWDVTIPPDERDEHLADKLKAEAPAILAWLVDGAHHYLEHGLTAPSQVQAATNAYRTAEDTAASFAASLGLVVGPEVRGRTSTSDLRGDHDAWCIDNGVTAAEEWPKLVAWLKARGATPGRTNRGRHWDHTLIKGTDEAQK